MASLPNKLKLLCWEGYEASEITQPFEARYDTTLDVDTLLSDAIAADNICSNKSSRPDLININNAYIRDYLHQQDMIFTLDDDLKATYLDSIHPVYQRLLPWSFTEDDNLIGIGQRFGPFNLVVNRDRISRETARDQGFNLANDFDSKYPYAILDYPDFNIFHIAIGADLNPFKALDQSEIQRFRHTATKWFENAKFISSDYLILNKHLVDDNIAFYISGGIYTAAVARIQGNLNIEAITPRVGPIKGLGGIVFTEITSILNQANISSNSHAFLNYIIEPEIAYSIALADNTANPVAQMGNPKVFNRFSTSQLDAIQWNSL